MNLDLARAQFAITTISSALLHSLVEHARERGQGLLAIVHAGDLSAFDRVLEPVRRSTQPGCVTGSPPGAPRRTRTGPGTGCELRPIRRVGLRCVRCRPRAAKAA